MGFTIRQLTQCGKFCDEVSTELFEKIYPKQVITDLLNQEQIVQKRTRKLTHILTVYLVIGMCIYSTLSITESIRKIAIGLYLLCDEQEQKIIGCSALHYRRKQIGGRIFAQLFKSCCQPIATEKTKGAFIYGLRKMSIDGTYFDLPDTVQNEKAFGRHYTQKGNSAFPQVQAVLLAECGTRCVVDAGVWPVHTSERVGGYRMLRSVEKDMLVMWDKGFHSYKMLNSVLKKQAHVLGRVPNGCKFVKKKQLPDGSYLSEIKSDTKGCPPITVRIIEYRIEDNTRDTKQECHRLITTLLDAELYPAKELILCYHERWEVELAIDEIDTYLLSSRQTIRSKSPMFVIQEIYGILLAHYMLRSFIHTTAEAGGIDPDRISFTGAIEVVKDVFFISQLLDHSECDYWYLRLLDLIARKIIPARRNRIYPRVVKKTSSKYERKKDKHKQCKQPQQTFEQVILVCA